MHMDYLMWWHPAEAQLGTGLKWNFPQHASSLRGLVWAELPLRVATVSRKGKTPAQEQLIQYLLATHLLITSDWDSSLAKFRAGELIPQGCASGEVWLTEQHWWNSLQQSVLWPQCFTPFFNAKYAHALTRPHPKLIKSSQGIWSPGSRGHVGPRCGTGCEDASRFEPETCGLKRHVMCLPHTCTQGREGDEVTATDTLNRRGREAHRGHWSRAFLKPWGSDVRVHFQCRESYLIRASSAAQKEFSKWCFSMVFGPSLWASFLGHIFSFP